MAWIMDSVRDTSGTCCRLRRSSALAEPPGRAGIGALTNTREPTGLIVLQVGYRAGIPAGPFLLALVIMALVTTACTGPAS